MDVKSAFVNGELAKEVHVQRQPGFAMKGAEQKVLWLCKAFYGLQQHRGHGTSSSTPASCRSDSPSAALMCDIPYFRRIIKLRWYFLWSTDIIVDAC
jgi:hypothetical protein